MVADVALDYRTGQCIAGRAGKVAVFPQLSTVHSCAKFGKRTKHASCRMAFQYRYRFAYCKARRKTTVDVNMIRRDVLLTYIDIVSLAYFDEQLGQVLSNRSRQDRAPSLRRPNQMILAVVNRMGTFTKPREAARRSGILYCTIGRQNEGRA